MTPEGKGLVMDTLFHAGLSNVLTATILAALVACMARPLARRPAVLHCLWFVVLLKLVTPPLYEVPIRLPEILREHWVSSQPDRPSDADLIDRFDAGVGASAITFE